MAPRTEGWLQGDASSTSMPSDETPRKRYPPLVVDSSSKSSSTAATTTSSSFSSRHRRLPPTTRVRTPRLRMGIHGWVGTASTVLTVVALLQASSSTTTTTTINDSDASSFQQPTTMFVIFFLTRIVPVLAAITSVVTARSGLVMVNQAPLSTVIVDGKGWMSMKVVPPHRDAFRRTAASVYYLSARILWSHFYSFLLRAAGAVVSSTSSVSSLVWIMDWSWGCFAVWYAMLRFVPRPHKIEWSNGNTYVFVLPMAAGITVDAVFQLPWWQCLPSSTITTTAAEENDSGEGGGVVSINGMSPHCWNDRIVTQVELLGVLLSALVVAFVFTLAFRGSVNIRKCYWGSAAVVHGICICLMYRALPFVMGLAT